MYLFALRWCVEAGNKKACVAREADAVWQNLHFQDRHKRVSVSHFYKQKWGHHLSPR